MTAAVVDQLAELVDPVTLEAAALADAGAIDGETVPCQTCGIPLIAHHDQDHAHAVPAAYALAMAALKSDDRDAMDDLVEQRNAAHVSSGKTGPAPSDAGACRRQLQYRDRPPADYVPRTDIDERRAALGGIIHDATQAAGAVRYPWVRYELPVPIPGLDRGGRIDKYDPVLGKVSDTKSAGRAKWGIVGDDGPPPSMWAQVRIYGYALECAGLPVKTLEIVAINRDTGAEEHFTEAYDPAVSLLELDELVAIATALELGVDMPRDGYGPSDWRCQWCPALDHCWSTDRAAQLGRSPRSLTLLGETPDDPAIVWAALELLRIAKERLELEKAEGRASELIQGLTPRVYGKDRADGGVELFNKLSVGKSYKAAYDALVELYARALDGDPEVPAADCLPEVPVTKSVKTSAKKPAREAARKARTKKTAKTPADTAAAVVEAMTEGTSK